jgi:hypothetical protein
MGKCYGHLSEEERFQLYQLREAGVTQTTGQALGVGLQSGGTFTATGYTTAQLQDPATASSVYAGWNLVGIWNTPVAGVSYPTLR